MKPAELRRLRQLPGFHPSQRKMAALLGLHRNTLNRYETGKRKIPKYIAISAHCLAHHGDRL